jgi:hypothetical protein
MLVNVTATAELFVTVTGTVVFTPTVLLPNAILVGFNVGGTATPVPLKGTFCVPALSVTVTDALSAPAAFGVNVTLIVQISEAATLEWQVLVSEKLLALVPVTAMLEI